MLFILAWLLWLYNSNHGNANSNKQQNEDGDKKKEPVSPAVAHEVEATLYDWERENQEDLPLLKEEYVTLDIPNKKPSEITPEEELYFQYAANASLGSSFSSETSSSKNIYKKQKSTGIVWVDLYIESVELLLDFFYFLSFLDKSVTFLLG